ncbi:MAG: hypothetical protein C4527_20775 [Candidatus Omnitrophota bacterium]|nr:MAG: hypothetical protein C4527_20775 [Candidatus Omnitrophota bacterium]
MKFRNFLFLFFVFSLSLLSTKAYSANSAFIVSPSQQLSDPVRIGIGELEQVLKQLDWSVKKSYGAARPDVSAGGMEIVIAAFSKSWAKAVEHDILRDMVPTEAESYSILAFPNQGGIRIYGVGIDDVGTMYAAFDIAEQIELGKFRTVAAVNINEKKQTPAILYRGVNLMIHTQALDDPVSWFHNEMFWREFLLVMTKSRFNLLDLHGAYDLMTTQFPNLLPYLVYMPEYGTIGIGEEKAERNLASLFRIVRMAHEHGIKVTLMNYSAPWSIEGNPGPPANDEALKAYTIMAVKKVLENTPPLDGIGFRVGESGRTIDFYQETYLPAIREAKVTPSLFIRTWMVKEKEILNLIDMYPGNTVLEVKFNGEHLALPYPVTGGRMSEWPGYSYENYLKLPRKYGILFQLATNGTHRIFPWADVDFVRETLKNTTIGGANGFVVETYSTYFPHSDAYTNTNQADLRYYNWTFERDWFWFLLWGRLAYNPAEPEELFRRHFEYHFNSQAGVLLYEALKNASTIVPTIAAVCNPGPGKRTMAPELDPPKRISEFLKIQPLDTFAMRSVAAEVGNLVSGQSDGRLSPQQALANAVLQAEQAVNLAANAEKTMLDSLPEGSVGENAIRRYRECRCWALDIQALVALGRHYRDKVSAAVHLGVFLETGDVPSLIIATEKVKQAGDAWADLCSATEIHYRPFLDTLRTGTTQFHWNLVTPNVELDTQELTLVYNNWLQTWQDTAKLGHLRVHKAPPRQPLLITVSIPSTIQADRIFANFQNSSGIAGRLTMEPARAPGVYYAEIPGVSVLEGAFQYFMFGAVAGQGVSAPGRNENPFVINITSDQSPPEVKTFEHSVIKGQNVVSIKGEFIDASGVVVAKVFWKPFPSDAAWSEMTMQRVGNAYTATFPCSSDGAQFAVELSDRFGNIKRIPNISEGIPYFTVSPSGRR